jgi:hypothetical protein
MNREKNVREGQFDSAFPPFPPAFRLPELDLTSNYQQKRTRSLMQSLLCVPEHV